MRSTSYWFCVAAIMAFLFASTGCGSQQAAGEQQSLALSTRPPATEHDHDHRHGDEHPGPHDGHVIELGRNHEYHAEIVEDDEHLLVVVYILDNDLHELSIDANLLTMSLMVDGAPRTFQLVAANANGGTASRFDATDATLFEALHAHETFGKLRVTIHGAPYVAHVEHHDHDDHAHGNGHNH